MYNFAKLGIGAALLCGAIVATTASADAQGYRGNRGYDQRQTQNYDPYTGRNMANIVNLIIDPMSGRRITQAEYQARYPWTDSRTWTYDSFTNLWTDHTLESGYAYQENYRGRYRRY